MANVPNNTTHVQQEEVQFRAAASESTLFAIGGRVNYCLENLSPVGTIMSSFLTEAQFQTYTSISWVLADGRDVTGSTFATLVSATLPDMRGQFVRGKNNGRSDGQENPDGELALGTQTPDKLAAHNHSITHTGHNHQIPNKGIAKDNDFHGDLHTGDPGAAGPNGSFTFTNAVPGFSINNAGSNETAPKSMTVNYFVKIN